jgi:hypothetical protein
MPGSHGFAAGSRQIAGQATLLQENHTTKHFCPKPLCAGIMSVIVNNRPDVVAWSQHQALPQGCMRHRLEFHGPHPGGRCWLERHNE